MEEKYKRRVSPTWRWARLGGLVAATSLAMVGLVAAPSHAQLLTLCRGTAADVTVPGDLAVPAGAACELTNVTITGNVTVRNGADLVLVDSTIQGDLTVRADAYADATGTSIAGVTRLRQAFGTFVEDSELGGRVDARNSGFFYSAGSTHGAAVVSRGGQTFIESGWVAGAVRSTGDLVTDLYDTVVTGRFDVDSADFGSVVCWSEVDGRATVSASGEVIQIGGTDPFADCGFNVFASDVTLQDNTGEIKIHGNVVRGDLVCTGNQVAPVGAGNRIRGEATGDCADLGAAIMTMSRAQAEAPEARTAEVRSDIEARVAAGEREAGAAGPANIGR